MKILFVIIFSGMALQLSAQVNVINDTDKSITILPRGITSHLPQSPTNVALGEWALINTHILFIQTKPKIKNNATQNIHPNRINLRFFTRHFNGIFIG